MGEFPIKSAEGGGLSEAAITCKCVLILSGWEGEWKAIHQTVSTCNLSSTKIAFIRG
jgi:hypothetical protein